MDLANASFLSNEPADTERLAELFVPFCVAGSTILLNGPIGAGKSFFARALIAALLDESEDIPSPTFTLVQTYQTRKLEIWHSDLYRITDPYDVLELGLDDAFETAFCVVEWPDLLGKFTPETAVNVTFETVADENQRLISVRSHSSVWMPLIRKIHAFS